MTAPPAPRSIRGSCPVPAWNVSGRPVSSANAQKRSYAGTLYAPDGNRAGRKSVRSPSFTTRAASVHAASTSSIGITAAGAKRSGCPANTSATHELYACASAICSAASGAMKHACSASVGKTTSPDTPSRS